ncbi:MAG: hypothetical protein KDC38_20425, partial [Planctomycetes bacterium]|nr:hypothetical protein [Planctomycetota bacterium]
MARFAWFLGVGLLGVLSSLPARADDSAPPRAAPRGAQVFGTMGRLGIPGRGTVFVIYESTEIAEEGTSRVRTTRQSIDRWIESTGDVRWGSVREFSVRAEGDQRHYQLREARRSVDVDVTGQTITHRQGGVLGQGPSKRMPEHMDEPRVVETELIRDYQELFDELLGGAGAARFDTLDGRTVAAIVPSRLGVHDFVFH